MRHDAGPAFPSGFQAARRLALAWAVIALTTSCTAAIDGSATTAGGGPSSTSPGVTDSGDVQYSSTVGPTTGDGTVAPDGSAGAPGSHDRWLPSETNPDPTVDIEGVYIGAPALYGQRYHFAAPDRVAYDRYPPVGGPHDPTWAACDGVVYDQPVRDEMMVHALEHGAVWIAYNPDTLSSADLVGLTTLVPQVGYLVMSPYPELDTPLSLQAWGHQLPLESGADPRFQQFLLAMLRNPFLTPEPNATCSNPAFDVAEPPPFVAEAPGPGAIPLDYTPPADGDTATTTTG